MQQILEPHLVEQKHLFVSDRRDFGRPAWRWLEGKDRALLEMASIGVTHRAIAACVGTTPGTVTRRIFALSKRLSSPLTQYLINPTCPLDPQSLRAARLHLITGLSIRQIARLLGVSYTVARRQISYVEGVCLGVGARQLSTSMSRR